MAGDARVLPVPLGEVHAGGTNPMGAGIISGKAEAGLVEPGPPSP